MRKSLFAFLLIYLCVACSAQAKQKPNWGNANKYAQFHVPRVYIHSDQRDELNGELVELHHLEWRKAIYKSFALIDENLLEELLGERKIQFRFYADFTQPSGDLAFYNEGIIFINLIPEPVSSNRWETVTADGKIEEEEMICVLLHEMAHALLDPRVSQENYDFHADWYEINNERPPTFSARYMNEDLADSFYLFAIWPDYFESNFSVRSGKMEKKLGRRFYFDIKMPTSISSRLTTPYTKKEEK